MDRREHLKLLFAGSMGAGLFFTTSCSEADRETSERIIEENRYGRTADELALDDRLNAETFFTEPERRMVEVLSDIILPADEVSGSATDAGVPDFIEFMMKDIPSFQVPFRGGLMWLNRECVNRFGSSLVDCSSSEQLEMIDEIAWPEQVKPGMEYGVRFFNRMRDLVATGFFTSRPGIEDLGYQGNLPNVWDGVPAEVLGKHGLSYDRKTLNECVRPEDRNRIAEWDENGRLIT